MLLKEFCGAFPLNAKMPVLEGVYCSQIEKV
jgi:hypothetical protein